MFWPVVTKTLSNFIFVTHEIKVESTMRDFPYQLELGDIGPRGRPFMGMALVDTEDETTEAGLRHPGRLGDVDRYVRQLISPFAEAQKDESTILATELHPSFAEELEGHNLEFETVPEMASSCSSSMNVETQASQTETGGQRAGRDHFNVQNTEST